jgi:hypothetical protein
MSCSIEGCGSKIYARGWCRKHYRHVVEGGHKEPLPIRALNCSCGAALLDKAGSGNLCQPCYYKVWKQENLESQSSYHKAYRKNNSTKIRKQIKEWFANNKERQNIWYACKRKDPLYKLAHNLRSRLWTFLKGKAKHKNTESLTGCSFEELKKHLEVQFEPGMTWDNYGSYWSVDHMEPFVSICPNDKIAIERITHYSNLKPLTISENSRKSAKDKKWKKIQKLVD